jgi:exodeoxyribonuclease VII small subunit
VTDQDTNPGYAAAMTELAEILEQIEGDEVDVDALSVLVTRAVELIRFCRTRIDATRMEVETVIAALDEPGANQPG